jgi:hypothetical protein
VVSSGRPAQHVAAALAALGLVLGAPSAAAASPEARVKAAYLYKLASFVRWPDDTARGGEFRLCVAGNNDVAAALRDLVRGQRVLGMPVTVATIEASAAGQAHGCEVLFVGRGREASQALLAAADRQPVLTVADRNGGTRGGVVDFILRDGKVRFIIDRTVARRQGLELSSKLLDIALAVEG